MIRRATRDEAKPISALAMRSKAHWGYTDEFMEACRAELTWSPEALEAPNVSFFVAEVGSELAGFYAIERISELEFELAALFVEPARIGCGVGRALVEHAKLEVSERGGSALLIQGDPHAEQFYRAAGGELVGHRPSASVPGRSLPLFKVPLVESHLMRRHFKQIDVFGAQPFSGNPLAVVLDADGLSPEAMQHCTRWMNLSETAFLLPANSEVADYRVRIFTLARELPFAGHPTLGSCHAWLAAGGEPRCADRIVQECEAGLVTIRRDDNGLAFAAPPLLRSGPVDEPLVEQLASVLGIDRGRILDAQWVDNGPGWVAVLLEDADTVLALEPDFSRYSGEGSLDIGLVGPYPTGSECAFEVRALFSGERGEMREDPVTGSLNASIAQWLLATGRAAAPYVASQGTRLGRQGRLRIDQDADGTVWVGGTTFTCINGEIEI